MNRKIFFIIFIILIFVIIVGAYFFVELPLQNKHLEYHNLSIGVYDQDNEFLKMNYTIFYDGIAQKTGTTSISGYVKEVVLVNKTIQVIVEDIKYYPQVIEINDSIQEPRSIRADFFPVPIGDIQIRHEGQFFIDKPIKIELIAEGEARNLIVCFKWEKGIINVYINNKTIIEKPDRLKVDKCYDLNVTIKDNSYVFDIDYKKFLGFDDNQLIVYVIDQEFTSDSIFQVVPSKNSNDIGIPDKIYILDTK